MSLRKLIAYFVRHGQSEDNIKPVALTLESPLSENGLKQADSAAERSKKIHFEKVISSPLSRARQTAARISEVSGRSVDFSDLFVERIIPSSFPGCWQDSR